jgi:4-hydroxy-tetrahydrodipicolinate reductase
MGRCVIEQASRDPRFHIVAAIDQTGDRTLPPCDVIIDFTNAAGTMEWLSVCEKHRVAMVIGATGHDQRQLTRIEQAARSVPIVKAANFSVGVNVLLDLVGKVAAALGPDYDIEIVETHHRHKVDAPSGTALAIADELRGATGQGESLPSGPRQSPLSDPSRDRKGAVIFGRHGATGQRPSGQLAIHAVRMGDIVGRHEVHFGGPGETITIRHAAHSRDTFAAGALRAAAWVVGRAPGLYGMRDVLGT